MSDNRTVVTGAKRGVTIRNWFPFSRTLSELSLPTFPPKSHYLCKKKSLRLGSVTLSLPKRILLKFKRVEKSVHNPYRKRDWDLTV